MLLGSLSPKATHAVTTPAYQRRVIEKGCAVKTRTLAIIILVVASTLGTTVTACSSAQEPSASDQSTGDSTAASADESASNSSSYVTVDVNAAYEQLSSNTEAQIVDVREPSEWATTGVPIGAVLIPLADLEARAATELAKDKPVYVICRSGNRSRVGSEILLGLGYDEVYNVDGGVLAWLAAGLPVESYAP